jgi:hypothetical protein
MVSKNHYLRLSPFTNPDVTNKVQFKSLKSSQSFRSIITPLFVCFVSFFVRHGAMQGAAGCQHLFKNNLGGLVRDIKIY